jgi:RNA exonuclease 1
MYICCQRDHPHEGCSRGCHVFYESDPAALHSRHPFSAEEDVLPDSAGQMAVAIDCEMVYTTAGMTVARVSVVDENGDVLFDELVKPSDGVVVT